MTGDAAKNAILGGLIERNIKIVSSGLRVLEKSRGRLTFNDLCTFALFLNPFLAYMIDRIEERDLLTALLRGERDTTLMVANVSFSHGLRGRYVKILRFADTRGVFSAQDRIDMALSKRGINRKDINYLLSLLDRSGGFEFKSLILIAIAYLSGKDRKKFADFGNELPSWIGETVLPWWSYSNTKLGTLTLQTAGLDDSYSKAWRMYEIYGRDRSDAQILEMLSLYQGSGGIKEAEWKRASERIKRALLEFKEE